MPDFCISKFEETADEKQEDEESVSKPAKDKPLFPQQLIKQNLKDILFGHLRHEYVDKMPPFQIEITSKLYEASLQNYTSNENCTPNEEADLILQKLQALFCSRVLPDEAITEAVTFLNLNQSLRGYASLKSILMNKNEAVPYLLNICPQCLLQYGKVTSTRPIISMSFMLFVF